LYTYDAEGRLIATAGTEYEYNANGERVSKDNAAGAPQTLYLHDGDGNQIAELNAALAPQHVNVYSGKHLVGTWNPASGKVYYAYADWLGTKRYEADGAGAYVNSWASLPFGDNQTALGAGPDATEHHFTGQEHDAESGLDHFAARYYQSQTGRWLLPDWSATPVPVPYATFTNPQSLNLYTYVGNNPVNAVDGDGHVDPQQNGNGGTGNNPNFKNGNPACGPNTGGGSGGLPSGVCAVPEKQQKAQQQKTSLWGSITGALAAGVARISPSAARKLWEAANPGQTVPFDAVRGRFFDMAHIKALADGGTNAAENLKPQEHGEHMAEHVSNGDFARWASNARDTVVNGFKAAEEELGEDARESFNAIKSDVSSGASELLQNPGEAIRDVVNTAVQAEESGEIPPP